METAGKAGRRRWPLAEGTAVEISLSTAMMLAGLLAAIVWPGLPSVLVLLLLAVVWFSLLFFFRDPERTGPYGTHLVLSPADGQVLLVDEADERDFLMGRARRVGIFLSLLDVHINRSPISGLVEFVRHQPGKFHQAFRPEASWENEHNLLGIVDGEDRVLVKQIAGILARRVVCRVHPGDRLTAGERFGLIKFGSRVEVYLPYHYEICVREDQHVKAGLTVIARNPQAAPSTYPGGRGGDNA